MTESGGLHYCFGKKKKKGGSHRLEIRWLPPLRLCGYLRMKEGELGISKFGGCHLFSAAYRWN